MKRIHFVEIFLMLFVVFLIFNYNIRLTDDISRHFKLFMSVKERITVEESLFYYRENYTNFIFYMIIVFFKKLKINFIWIVVMITITYYGVIFYLINNEERIKLKEKILLLTLVFMIINPFYILTVLHYPLAITFICFALIFRRKRIKLLEGICILLSYYTHTGTIYIIITYLLLRINIIFSILKNFLMKKKKLGIFMGLLLIFNSLFLEKILINFVQVTNNIYLKNKISAYILKKDIIKSFYGGLGLGQLLAIFYMSIILIITYLLSKKEKFTFEHVFSYILLMGCLVLTSINNIFLIRAIYVLIFIYPILYKSIGKEKRVIINVLILFSLIFLREYKFLLSL